ncbi:MAG: hypothetical protein IJ047_04425 [Paludibacteraceae bacterium]|nr:hypothetical protein [Paludibacteraceae bacterium]
MKKIYVQPRTETVATTPQQMLCASGGIKAQISGYKQNNGSGFSQTFVWLAGIVCSSLLMLGTACSTTNNPDQPKQQTELKPRTLIVQQSAVSHQLSAVRRLPQATITENNEGDLDALWEINDEVFYRNLSYSYDYYVNDDDSKPLFGTLRADKEASIASFSGDRVWCDETNQLALIYPALDPADFTFHESPLSSEYTISVAGQDGSLATLAEKYHHIYGIASVVSVTGTTANAELAEMKSLLTVCKFSFVDENDKPLQISTLEIGYYTMSDGPNEGKYPQKGTVSIAQNTPVENVHVEPSDVPLSAPLTITTPTGTTPTEVYVALFPQTEQSYKFTVTNSNGTYTGTARATLNEGEFVVATGLRLTKNN